MACKDSNTPAGVIFDLALLSAPVLRYTGQID